MVPVNDNGSTKQIPPTYLVVHYMFFMYIYIYILMRSFVVVQLTMYAHTSI